MPEFKRPHGKPDYSFVTQHGQKISFWWKELVQTNSGWPGCVYKVLIKINVWSNAGWSFQDDFGTYKYSQVGWFDEHSSNIKNAYIAWLLEREIFNGKKEKTTCRCNKKTA